MAIESISGAVTVEEVDGETRVEVISGAVRLTSLSHLVEVEAESFRGDFSSDLPIMVGRDGRTREATVFDRGIRSLEGTAGAGGARLELSTFRGSIAIETR